MKNDERYHGLDSLRGTMLLLGLVLHAGLAYLTASDELRDPTHWYFYDATESSLMAPLCGAIHAYRMPVFFVLAGFFAALLLAKRGQAGLLSNRGHRVAIPLAVAMFTIVPLIHFGSVFAWSQVVRVPAGFGIPAGFFGMFSDNLYHLWFLWHLIIFYLATAAVAIIGKSLPPKWQSVFLRGCQRLVGSNWGMPAFAVFSIVFLTQMETQPGNLDNASGFFPPWQVLGIYGLCYSYGFCLYLNRSRLQRLENHANFRMTAGVVSVAAYLGIMGWYLAAEKPPFLNGPLVVLSAISIWTLIEGWLAIFQKYFSSPSRIWRYISDSSYWVYLIHVPVLLYCQGLLANAKVIAEVKFLMVLLLTTAICFFTYHFFVRATLIGKLLNGRRYPLWLVKPSTSPAQLSEV